MKFLHNVRTDKMFQVFALDLVKWLVCVLITCSG